MVMSEFPHMTRPQITGLNSRSFIKVNTINKNFKTWPKHDTTGFLIFCVANAKPLGYVQVFGLHHL